MISNNPNTGDNEPKPEEHGRAQRAAGWMFRRGRIDRAFSTATAGADWIGDIAGKQKPKPIDWKGFGGRYRDGGVERFRDLSQNMSRTDLEQQLHGWQQQRFVFQYASLLSILAVPLGIVFFRISAFLAIGLIALFLFSLFRAIRADYFAWIIEQKRFGGFYDYLSTRLPRNVQIILPPDKRDDGK
ncbi:hypothetical protein [Nitratireductor sp. XY-223]|uniref:hypothetical protein n=1 Tax=Nitratireductor sp. XY-223 TaxID=2561926 RepID=UPI0010AA34BF|nr:hypothetical protein [Nitratireductor sp. XY-223]